MWPMVDADGNVLCASCLEWTPVADLHVDPWDGQVMDLCVLCAEDD
jgi:hypothetical protein